MKKNNEITVEFVLAYPSMIERQKIIVHKGVKLYEAKKYLKPNLLDAWNKSNAVAIDSELVQSNIELTNDVRVIILRKLINDPKQLRRNRAKND